MRGEKLEKNINLIAILWIALGAMSFMAGFMVFIILFGVSFIPHMGYEAPIILRSVGLGIGLFLVILSIPNIICGIGLTKKKEWARILTLILAFLSLLNFPLGTALGVYSFVILLKDEAIQLFKA